MSDQESLRSEEVEGLDKEIENDAGDVIDVEGVVVDDDAPTDDGTKESEPEEIVAALAAKVKELEEENSELKNQYLRKQADFENFRKRMMREKQEASQFSNQQLLLDLVSVIDDFERAIKSADDSRDYDAFHDGVVIIEKQLTGMLQRKWGLARYDAAGEPFDPQKHEAVAMEEREDMDETVVLEEYQKGYTLHDRVIRSAKVKVSTPKVAPESEGE